MKIALLFLLLAVAIPATADEVLDLSHDEGQIFEFILRDTEYFRLDVANPVFMSKLEAAKKQLTVRDREAQREQICTPGGQLKTYGRDLLLLLNGLADIRLEVKRATYKDFRESLSDSELVLLDQIMNHMASGFSSTLHRTDHVATWGSNTAELEALMTSQCLLWTAEAEAEK